MQGSVAYNLGFAALVCFVCAVLVASAAVSLRERQEANAALEKQRNVLIAAGLASGREGLTREEVAQRSAAIRQVVIDLATGEELPDIDPQTFDQSREAAEPSSSREAPPNTAQVERIPHRALVYQLLDERGEIRLLILPVEGAGLWSTLRGFMALDADLDTIRGITFYEHKETPGLGGEVDNPKWKALWQGRKAFDESFEPTIAVIKGRAGTAEEDPYHVDGLAGATITSRGVTNLLHFWLGENGFAAYLNRIPRKQEAGSLMASRARTALVDPLISNNPITLQVLGICSALAVTTKMDTALVMSAAVISVLLLSNFFVSVLRNQIPTSIRIIVQLTIIASLVIVVDQVLQAYVFEISKQLSVFVGLIITNCIIMGRAEAYAMPKSSRPECGRWHRQWARIRHHLDGHGVPPGAVRLRVGVRRFDPPAGG